MITAIIPARGGSKRLPGKNLARIGGSTLVELAIRCAFGVDSLVPFVTTDCDAIALEAMRNGAAVIPRSKEMASDTATSEAVAIEVCNYLGLGPDDYIFLLQPTSPLRTSDDVENVFASPELCAFSSWDGKTPNGAVYTTTVRWLTDGKKFSDGAPVYMPRDRSIDIDTAEDLARAQEWWCRMAVA